jgi:hypothetical protein
MKPSMIYALCGSLLFIIMWMLTEKNLRDKDPKYDQKSSWKQFLWKSLDDFLFAIVCGVVVGYFPQPIFGLLIWLLAMDADAALQYYDEHPDWVIFGMGVFGSVIIKTLYEAGMFALKMVRGKLFKVFKALK